MRTLELKVRCADLGLAARQLALLGSAPVEQVVHVDTFFDVPEGLLRLREQREALERPDDADEVARLDAGEAGAGASEAGAGGGGRAHLIAVLREGPGAAGGVVCRGSALVAKDPAAVRAIHARMFGLRGVVKKARTSYPFYDVMVHLDEVVGLGTFVEVHAPLGPAAGGGGAEDDADDPEAARRRDQMSGVLVALGLDPAAALAAPYVELLHGARAGR